MFIKIIIVILFIGNLLALSRSFYTLLTKRGTSDTANMLTVRVILAGLLLCAVGFGLWTGDLNISAPWHYPQ